MTALAIAPALGAQDWSRWRTDLTAAFDLSIDDRALDLFQRYAAVLIAANREMNLLSSASMSDLLYRHLFDSLAVVPVLRGRGMTVEGAAVLDYGSGAGLPGIPLAIAVPAVRVTLVDSIAKKCDFLRDATENLGLGTCGVINERMEVLGRDPAHREGYDAVVTRAAARLTAALECGLPLVRPGGIMAVFARSDSALPETGRALEALGARTGTAVSCALPNRPATIVLVYEKIRQTPEKYPRRSGIPEKRPL